MARRGIRKRKKDTEVIKRKGETQNYVLTEFDKTNENFCLYYKSQGIVKDDEWDAFIAALKDDLPTSFRIQGSNNEAQSLIELMNSRYFEPMKLWEDGETFIPKRLPWYPNAFQTPISRATLRSRPLLKDFHNFLITEAELGNISRQEAVSMIPPLLLDIKSHHKVLDVCAAPGSKTVQIIEMMHCDDKIPEGLILANDVDNSRCYLLVRQALKRMPTSNCIVINEDAAFLPNLSGDKDPSEPLLFDRVLCDVICSGDGTFRKSPDMWQSWNPVKGLGLHKLQVNIAQRAVQQLAVNGLMVYSTCSLNPIENEAVIASILRSSAGALEIVDVSKQLPQLKRTSGLSKWRVFDKNMCEYNVFEDISDDQKRYFTLSMFPPNDEEIRKFHLERCFRILPHMQNTGGFFVAVLKKSKPLKQEKLAFNLPSMKSRRTFKEDPFVFVEKDDARWKDIASHYGVMDMFPYQNLFGRTAAADKKRTLYFVNSAVKRFLLFNQDKVKVINAGIRMFGRVENKYNLCRFRILQDGVKTILPYLEKRTIEISPDDMLKILKAENGNCSKDELTCEEKFRNISSGCVVLISEYNGLKQVICAWMGARSLTPYVSKEEKIHTLRLLNFDTSGFERVMWTKRQSKAFHDREEAKKRKMLSDQIEEGEKLNNGYSERDEKMGEDEKTLMSSGRLKMLKMCDKMKRAEPTNELFKKLTFGIRKSWLKQKKEETDRGLLISRILPNNYKDGWKKNESANTESGFSPATSGKEPEILRGLENVSKKKRKYKGLAAKKEQIAHLRKLNRIYVWGDNIPDPMTNFTEIEEFPQKLLNNLKEFGITEPTAIQMQAIPVMLQKRDLLCSAPTGSGKTLAFALPIIFDVVRSKNYATDDQYPTLNSVILEPTYELAKQTYVQFLKFSQNLPISCSFLEKDEIPENAIRKNPSVVIDPALSEDFLANVVISTPNKLIYALKKNNKILSDGMNWLVIDESDRLFDTTEGDDKCFRSQLAKICQAFSGNPVCRAFFSATFSYEVEDWCKSNLHDAAMICVGSRNSAVNSVKQELIFAGSEHGKIIALKALFQNSFEPPALIFVQSKLRAKQLVSIIESLQPPVPVRMISSEKTEIERESAIVEFRSGDVWVLVCTDLMGRGLDLSGVNLVVNFDLPTSIISYIHRIGRTGRAGRRGHAVTYFTESDLNFIRPIATVIKQAGFEVPEYTLQMRKPTKNEKKKLLKHAPKRKNIGSLKKEHGKKRIGKKKLRQEQVTIT